MHWPKEKEEYGNKIINALYDEGLVQTWFKNKEEGWTLRNGEWSPYYINLRPITSKKTSRNLLTLIGQALGRLLQEETPGVTKIIGIPLTGIPIATSITICSGIPSCNARVIPNIRTVEQFREAVLEGKFEKEEYGDHDLIEGDIEDMEKLAIVDDIVTNFGTKAIILKQVDYVAKRRGINVHCDDVVVLVDREQGAEEVAHQSRVNIYSLIPFNPSSSDSNQYQYQ